MPHSSQENQNMFANNLESPLSDRLAQILLHYNTKFASETSDGVKIPVFQATLATAGGGNTALSAIASTVNASSFLLEGMVTYDRLSFTNFVTAPSLIKKGIGMEQRNDEYDTTRVVPKDFRFSSPVAAQCLAKASLKKSFGYAFTKAKYFSPSSPPSSENQPQQNNINNAYQSMEHCIGVGCTGMLSSAPGIHATKRNPNGHICIMFSDGSTFDMSCEINKSQIQQRQSNENDALTNRKIQDEMVSCVILLSVLISMQNKLSHNVDLGIIDKEEGTTALHHLDEVIQSAVFQLTNHQSKNDETNHNDSNRFPPMTLIPSPISIGSNSFTNAKNSQNLSNLISKKAREVILGDTQAVLLLAKQQPNTFTAKSNGTTKQQTRYTFTAFQETVLPMDSLIFPGSFNPMHIGHITLAKSALKVIQEKRLLEYNQQQQQLQKQYETYSSLPTVEMDLEQVNVDIWDVATKPNLAHNGTTGLSSFPPPPPAIFFEMSITNADKAAMDIKQVQQRAEWVLDEMAKFSEDHNCASKNQISISTWGVLLDSVPLFVDKVQMLEQHFASFYPSKLSSNNASQNQRRMTFVIGTDTLIRLLDSKYYDNNNDNMLSAMRDMKSRGVHFVVGGRSEQVKGDIKHTGAIKFIDGSEELKSQPHDVKEMFTLLKEKDFRVDMSSTEIRKIHNLQ